MEKKHIVVIGSRFPFPLEKGDKLRLYYQIKALSKEYVVHLISLTAFDINEKHKKALAEICATIDIYKIPVWLRFISVLSFFIKRQSIQVGYFYNKQVAKAIHRKINHEIKPDIIFCQLIRASEYVKDLKYYKVLDLMDTFSLGMKRRAEKSPLFTRWIFNSEAQKIAQYETQILDKFDKTCIISAQDRDKIRLGAPTNIEIIPNGVDIDYFKYKKDINPQHQIGFIGNLGYFPNKVAVDYLLDNIQAQKKYSILIAGARAEKSLRNRANDKISVWGWVDDIRDAYRDIQIFVAPLFSGIGQQNKILEAMSLGIPCITTSLVNKAILAKPDDEILIADTVEAFSKQIDLLLNDVKKRQQISENARSFVEKKYAWSYFDKKMLNLVKKSH